jgi:hypothetical protein
MIVSDNGTEFNGCLAHLFAALSLASRGRFH